MDEIHHPVIKGALAAGAYASIAWLDWITAAGKVCAALMAMALLAEWLWKKVIKPLFRFFGWIKTPQWEELE